MSAFPSRSRSEPGSPGCLQSHRTQPSWWPAVFPKAPTPLHTGPPRLDCLPELVLLKAKFSCLPWWRSPNPAPLSTWSLKAASHIPKVSLGLPTLSCLTTHATRRGRGFCSHWPVSSLVSMVWHLVCFLVHSRPSVCRCWFNLLVECSGQIGWIREYAINFSHLPCLGREPGTGHLCVTKEGKRAQSRWTTSPRPQN